MSAFAADRHISAMIERTAKSVPSITARPSAAEKARFSELAMRAGMSESALALVAIRTLLDSDGKPPPQTTTTAMQRLAATDRVTIRLRPGDGATITERATARGMKVSAYLAALVRAHVQANPPLPAAELAALRKSVAILAGLGHVFAHVARAPVLTGVDYEAMRKDITQVRIALRNLEQQTHELAKAALIAWESRSE